MLSVISQPELAHELWVATYETLAMVFASGLVATALGMPFGVALWATAPTRPLATSGVYRLLSIAVNILRSVPFIILMMTIIPLTRLIVGTSIGTLAAVVPLTLSAMPFVARTTEGALQSLPRGLLETAEAMGATPGQTIFHMLLPEALPELIHSTTLMLVNLVGYAAMAGAVGGGGLGDFAIRYGYQRFDAQLMALTVLILVVLVQCMQALGNVLAARAAHSRA